MLAALHADNIYCNTLAIRNALTYADALPFFRKDSRKLDAWHRGGKTGLDERFDLDDVAWDGQEV